MLENFFFWPQGSIISVPSSRYSDSVIPHLPVPTIFLPYDFQLSSFSRSLVSVSLSILHSYVNFSILNPSIRNHPHAQSSSKHNQLISSLRIQIQHFQNHEPSVLDLPLIFKNKISLVLGNSAVIFELLNSNVAVLHHASSPVYDLLDPCLWPDITILRINDYVSLYLPSSAFNLFAPSQSSLLEYI